MKRLTTNQLETVERHQARSDYEGAEKCSCKLCERYYQELRILGDLINRKRELRQHLLSYVVPSARKLQLTEELGYVEDRIAEENTPRS